MSSLYSRWMYNWETRLTSVDKNRVVRPLEWGIEWSREWPCRNGFLPHQTQAECERYLLEYNARAVAASDEFFDHDSSRPAEIRRADYAVSANIGRTMDACRQAVLDVRCCLDWLQQQGYERLGITGTSLGSCYAFLAAAHDSRIQVAAFNHASTYVADVV